MAEAEKEADSYSSSEEDDGLCEYERMRLENIRRNHNMLRSLGLPLPSKPKLMPVTKRGGRRGRGRGGGGGRKKRRKKKVESDSDSSFKCDSSESSSEDEWEPLKEQAKRKPRGRGVGKIGPLDAQVKQKIFNEAKIAIREKLDTLKEGRKKKRGVCVGGNAKQKKKGKAAKLEELFQSSEDEQINDFAGFTEQEVDKCFNEVCKKVPSARELQWEALFGVDDDDETCEMDFKGFTMEEILSTKVPERRSAVPVSHRTREKAKVDYQEPVISDDDEYLFCEDCQELHHGDCPIHGALTPLPDIGFDEDSKKFTKLPVPAQLTVKTSSILSAGLGVFATQDIARGVKFGPYVGKKIPSSRVDEDTVTSYMWEIKQDGVKSYYIDGRVEECSNWLRFINCARNEEEQNLLAFQYKGHIYYRTFKPVFPGNELLVWYGEEYAKDLGISVEYSDEQVVHLCKGCGASFVEKSSFELHLRHSKKCAEANPRTYKCGKCQRTFNELSLLQSHIRRHLEYDKENSNPRSKSQYNDVEEEDELFYDEPSVSLKSKIKKKRGSRKSHDCQYCGKTWSSANDLLRHLRTHTNEKPYQCQYCSKRFSLEGNLKTHIMIHTGDRPFQCEHCGKRFNQVSHLQSHIRFHTGDRPYQCQFCDKSFSRDSNLKSHIRTHTGDRPYQCQFCNKSFNHDSNLKKHIRIHTGEKPFQCQYCNKSFTQDGDLKRHIRTHTGDKPFHCTHCGDSFSVPGNLKSHIRRKHS